MKVRVVAAAVVLAAGVTGCSGKSDPIQTPETVGIPGTALPVPGEGATSGPVPTAESPSSAQTASGTSSSAVTPQNGGFSDEDLKTSVAFVREYLAAYNAAVKNPPGASLKRFVLPSCKSCAGLEEGIVELAEAGHHQDSDGIRIARIRPDFGPNRFVVVTLLDQPASKVVDEKGAKVGSIKAKSGLRQAFVLARSGSSWKIKHLKDYLGDV